jgi:hypothetical protein
MREESYIKHNKFLSINSAMLKIYIRIVLIPAVPIAVALGFGEIPSLLRAGWVLLFLRHTHSFSSILWH